jgi:hypothetical protein
MSVKNRYERLIEAIFLSHYTPGCTEFEFEREEIEKFARKLRIKLPKNLGDLIYSFRYRVSLPDAIRERAPKGMTWVIMPAGRSRYQFRATAAQPEVAPSSLLSIVKVPDSTPGVISMYALTDEQALLARLRYNRLLDIFSRTTCYSLQSHLRTTVPSVGQVETDEVYVSVDRRGAHYVLPVQAKGKKDRLSLVQVRQDIGMCRHKFPNLICRPIGAQFTQHAVIALFEFEEHGGDLTVALEKHYQLVPADELTTEDLRRYAQAQDYGADDA